jgi:hypothetical protein
LTMVPAGEPSPPLSLPLPPLVTVSSPPHFLPCASARLRGGRRARPAAHPGALKRGGAPPAVQRVQLAAAAACQFAAATARAPSCGVAACQLTAAVARATFRGMAASLRVAAWLGQPAWRPVDSLRATAYGPPAWLARGWVRAQQRGLPAQMPHRARVQQPHTGSSSARPARLIVYRCRKVRSRPLIPFFLVASTTKCPPHVVASCLCLRALDPASVCVVHRRVIPVSSLVEMGSRRLPLCTAPGRRDLPNRVRNRPKTHPRS